MHQVLKFSYQGAKENATKIAHAVTSATTPRQHRPRQ
jgi:hypothetical protein